MINVKNDFPIFNNKINGKELIYLDNASTTQKPSSVINSMTNYYTSINASPHRGAYSLSQLSTDAYEGVREKVRDFIGAEGAESIVFTKNSTEALNLIMYSYGNNHIKEGDEIVISILEHHSNSVIWQDLAHRKNAKLKYLYTDENFKITNKEIESKITEKTKIVAITHASNTLGTVLDISYIIERAHKMGAVVIVDGTQYVPHYRVNVTDLDADFYVFSGHKMLAPNGIGIMYGKKDILDDMPPFLFGGDMVEYVTEEKSTFAKSPGKFEAGTQDMAAVIGLGSAIDYILGIGYDNIKDHSTKILSYATAKLNELGYVQTYGTQNLENRLPVISFNVSGVHSHDTSSILNEYGVCIRAGHHCTQPLMKYINVNSTCRASFYIYTTTSDIDAFINALGNVRRWLGYESE